MGIRDRLGTIGISMDFIGNEWKFKHRKFKLMEIGNEGDYCPEIHQWGMFRLAGLQF
jgi:hypothetical protein